MTRFNWIAETGKERALTGKMGLISGYARQDW